MNYIFILDNEKINQPKLFSCIKIYINPNKKTKELEDKFNEIHPVNNPIKNITLFKYDHNKEIPVFFLIYFIKFYKNFKH